MLLHFYKFDLLRLNFETYTNSINDCNTSLGQDAMNRDAMNRVSTNGVFVAFFFPIGITPRI
ncbi:hypothetical protein GXM_04536 [Nostoc sphaeroides CCNUC1]|uniref:Uncharacterized protein n=1 Tax=Nostoc sphaeroides CCNUC1 TaxID=2653204 RepID=A0A5P8W2V5_9NOSO|nr:hypothetical protein GXM_04536 [Nostoc sphaeroides CCNUC1]